jgi:ABC-2 type transport system ATP-binding protein
VNTVELKNVRKAYGNFVAVDDLSFSIAPGTVFGLLGPNGAGKTSTIRMMIGIILPDSGEVRLFGEPFRRAHLERIGYLPEERGLYKRMKVLDHLVLLGRLHGLDAATAKRKAESWCERLEIASWTQKKVEELSKGMQQKIQFIAALMHEPDFIIMDEPFTGLDPVNTALLKSVIMELKEAGKSVLFSTHQMEQVERMCDSILLINRGKAVLHGELREVKSRYGRDTVLLEFEGDASFLEQPALVQSVKRNGRGVEVRLAPGADAQDLLQAAMPRVRMSKFELLEPTLEEIFIEVVGKSSE